MKRKEIGAPPLILLCVAIIIFAFPSPRFFTISDCLVIHEEKIYILLFFYILEILYLLGFRNKSILDVIFEKKSS
ncbi:hypothetical protein B9Z55_026028 [Caenorhabditis nigoni]|uniref:Uncharacterized protein n=1 Tax=Caenorhabditis nigoni TaxID=1611254 RepID=A0A2G5T1G4_9PELO|nr:hypothetical protein B9Z55_026028 [Caenorhabditis nigoni]